MNKLTSDLSGRLLAKSPDWNVWNKDTGLLLLVPKIFLLFSIIFNFFFNLFCFFRSHFLIFLHWHQTSLPQVWPKTFSSRCETWCRNARVQLSFSLICSCWGIFCHKFDQKLFVSSCETWCRSASVQLSFSHFSLLFLKGIFYHKFDQILFVPCTGPGVGMPVVNSVSHLYVLA